MRESLAGSLFGRRLKMLTHRILHDNIIWRRQYPKVFEHDLAGEWTRKAVLKCSEGLGPLGIYCQCIGAAALKTRIRPQVERSKTIQWGRR